MTLYDIRKIYHPSWFQGHGKSKRYFEGWYFKNVSRDGKSTWAFIPGVSFGGGRNHSFVQVIDGKIGRTWYFRYPQESFSYSRKGFEVRVAGSTFSDRGIDLDLQDETVAIKGSLKIDDPFRFPVSFFRPGIMGWYRYVPFMECYHGVVSLDHSLRGSLAVNGDRIDFSGGRGYIEKDWGASMPKSWIWMQSNHFDRDRTSFMISIARIPWLGRSFAGFLGFMLHQGILYPFATYTGAEIVRLQTEGPWVEVTVRARRFSISVRGKNNSPGVLKAPVSGDMSRVIHESVDAELQVRLADGKGRLIYEGRGRNAGLEAVGDVSGSSPGR